MQSLKTIQDAIQPKGYNDKLTDDSIPDGYCVMALNCWLDNNRIQERTGYSEVGTNTVTKPNLGLIAFETSSLKQILKINDNALGTAANLYYWNGVTWTEVLPYHGPGEGPGGSTQVLYSVDAQSAEEAWMVGNMKGIDGKIHPYALQWNGTDLVEQNAFPECNCSLNAVLILGKDNVMAVGGSDLGAIALRWDGSGWSSTPIQGADYLYALNQYAEGTDAYLLEVCRYVELNPVRARMVRKPESWPWSSYRAHIGSVAAPPWLDVEGLHGYLLGRAPAGSADRRRAIDQYMGLVAAGTDVHLWDTVLRQQIYLGDEAFVERMQRRTPASPVTTREVPRAQRMRVRTLAQWIAEAGDRDEGLLRAHIEGGISMTQLAAQLGLSVSRVSRITLLAGGLAGSALGVQVFGYLKSIGQIDVVIALAFIIMLSSMGGLMLAESSRTILRQKLKKPVVRRKLHQHYWVARWPLKVRYPKSRLYVSIFLPLLLGMGGGLLSAIMGIGGGFLLVPAMIYLLGMPTLLVIGTSALQIVFVAANVTVLQAWQNQTVDLFLSLMMIAGGVIGAPLGSRLSAKLPSEQLRALLALLLVGMAIKLLIDMVVTPEEIYVR